MQTTEEMQAEGIKREVKMMAMAKMGEMATSLGLIFVRDDEMEMAGHAADFVVALGRRIEELNAENVAAFQAFEAAATEVDQLEAMLAAGAEELELDARIEAQTWRRENQSDES